MTRKLCKDCGRRRLAKFFYAHPLTKDGLGTYCKDCMRVRGHITYMANKEKYVERAKQWEKNNKEAARASHRRSARSQRRKHGKRIRARHATYKKKHPQQFAEHENRRRARKLGTTVEKIDRREIYERDRGCCHLCGHGVSFRAMELDHVMPLARGGSHTRENLKVAHKKCNRKKWANVA